MKYLLMYNTFLPCAIVPSVTISFLISFDEMTNKSKPYIRIMNTIGILSVGTFIGLSYPISMPLLAGRYLYLNRNT